jgi:hypothetical protein
MQQLYDILSLLSNPVIFLTILGLVFEFLPFLLKVKKYGNPFKPMKEKKQDHYKRYKTVAETIDEKIKTFYVDFGLIFFGLFLQGIAVIWSEL